MGAFIYPGTDGTAMLRMPAILICFCIFLCILSSGCSTDRGTSPTDIPAPLTTGAPAQGIAPQETVIAEVLELKRFYTPDGGCFYESRVAVKNTGQSIQQSLVLRLNFVRARDGSIIDTRNIPVGPIRAEESKIFGEKERFTGDCATEYQILPYVL